MQLFTVTALFQGLPNVTKRVLARSQVHACEIVSDQCRMIRPVAIVSHAEPGLPSAIMGADGTLATMGGYLVSE